MDVDSPSHPALAVQSVYTDNDHHQMDDAVPQLLAQFNLSWHPSPSVLELTFVLLAVVHGDKRLDKKYRNVLTSLDLLNKDPSLQPIVANAWQTGSYRDIRTLAVLQAPMPEPAGGLSELLLDALRKGLSAIYRGPAVDAFSEYLGQNHQAFCKGGNEYYGKFYSIIQSSGTGKTRLMLELGTKDICVLYMNIRSPNDKQGYPYHDDIPANILTGCNTESEYLIQCYAFFASIFKVLRIFLEEEKKFNDWCKDMCKIGSRARALFFAAVGKEYENVKEEIHASSTGEVVMFRYYQQMAYSRSLPSGNKNAPGLGNTTGSGNPCGYDTRTCVGMVSSARVPVDGHLFFPPFTQLGWDQNTPILEKVQADEVGKAEHILRYGRPLYVLIGFAPLCPLLMLARDKLCGKPVFNPNDAHQAFAVLAQRFGFDFAFGPPKIESGATPLTLPSPFYHTSSRPEEMVSGGAVDIGQIGELVSRLLWLLAKDFFVRTKLDAPAHMSGGFEEVLQDCQLVPVVEFLTFVFGPKIWEVAPGAQTEFQNAYINFSHWVSMDFNVRQDKEVEQLPIETWTCCHWARTSAVQCCPNQPLIDKVIPMYFKPQKDGDRAGMSQILISDTARIGTRQSALFDIRRDHWSIAPDYRGLPYIAIVADLGVEESAFDVAVDSSKDMCLRVYASGLDATSYPFLDGYTKVTHILKDLYKRRFPPSGGDLQDLEDQVQFGRSSEPRHMNMKKRSTT
ncbi:hypothetical protein F5I97DRAFT_2035573 [Phlebopus sp. FC_14]|nr:hypothetical protein F5I97DRAFT_2035573 [Phlebopus sp. FC_14]